MTFSGFQNLTLTGPLAIIDLETTGTDVKRDKIVELAILVMAPKSRSALLETLINPGVPIPPAATAIHGIGDADVVDAPRFERMAEPIFNILNACDLCGYNLKRFDLPLLVEEFGRCGLKFDVADRTILDPFEIFRDMERHTLAGAITFYCGQQHDGAHTARQDVEAAAMVLDAQLARYVDLPRDVKQLHERFAGIDLLGRFRVEGGTVVFNFGKHCGRPLQEVAADSPDYLQWILDKGGFLDDVKNLVRRALDVDDFPEGG